MGALVRNKLKTDYKAFKC